MKRLQPIYIDMETGKWVTDANRTFSSIDLVVATQDTPAKDWLIIHNKNTDKLIAQTVVNDNVVFPNSVEILDSNTIMVTFDELTSGQINLMFF